MKSLYIDAATHWMYAKKDSTEIAIDRTPPATAPYNSQFTVTATAPGGTVIYSSGSTSVCTNSGATFTMISGTGTCIVQYNQSGNADYNAATHTSNVTATKATATVTLGNLIHTYDGTAKAATATTTPVGKTVTFTYNGTATIPVNVGSYVVIGTISDTNYQGSASGTMIIKPFLSVSVLGNGSGSINSDPSGITCSTGNTGVCSQAFLPGTVTLFATPSATSALSSWTGCSSIATETCFVSMAGNKSVSATFTLSPKAMIGTSGYDTLNQAYSAALGSAMTGATIKLLDAELVENLILTGKDIMLDGGYSTNFTTKSGLPTVLNGKITIKSGILRVNGVTLR